LRNEALFAKKKKNEIIRVVYVLNYFIFPSHVCQRQVKIDGKWILVREPGIGDCLLDRTARKQMETSWRLNDKKEVRCHHRTNIAGRSVFIQHAAFDDCRDEHKSEIGWGIEVLNGKEVAKCHEKVKIDGVSHILTRLHSSRCEE
jgi:hypothetical protein